VIESTYGDREHCEYDPEDALATAITRTLERGGVVVIPAFAVDRTEVVLYHLQRLMTSGAIPPLPVYADSPMALASLEVYRRAIEEGDEEIRAELREQPGVLCPKRLVEARGLEASKAIHDIAGPAIIISASGMATGGRVLHHLARRLPDARNCIIFVGFQPAGTRGRKLIDGCEQVKLLGQNVPVVAEIVDLSSFSVHADQGELLDWLAGAEREPDAVYVVHGEPDAAEALREQIQERLGWRALVPSYRERVVVAEPMEMVR
jgi:metallo-beta-lactamase family protein